MLSIEINGIPLDLPEDFSATLNLKSPLFNTVGDYTFPFKLPATPKNMGLLDWKHRVESNKDKYEYISADLLFSGQLIFSGSIRIKKAADDTYQGSLFVERGNFNFEIKDKWLNDIDFGNDTELRDEFKRIRKIGIDLDAKLPDKDSDKLKECCLKLKWGLYSKKYKINR